MASSILNGKYVCWYIYEELVLDWNVRIEWISGVSACVKINFTISFEQSVVFVSIGFFFLSIVVE